MIVLFHAPILGMQSGISYPSMTKESRYRSCTYKKEFKKSQTSRKRNYLVEFKR
jgi:hypothetical protein